MNLGRIGGALVALGLVALVVDAIFAAAGVATGLGAQGIGGVAVLATLSLLGFGAGALALAGTAPVKGRAVRLGLAVFSVGQLAVLGSAITSFLSTRGALEDLSSIVLFIGGGALTWLGLMILVIAVPARFVRRQAARRSPGQHREG